MNNYYFTFLLGDEEHKNNFVKIEAEDENDARDIMFKYFDSNWAFCYDEDDWFINLDTLSDVRKMLYNIDPNRKGYMSQMEIFGLTELNINDLVPLNQ